MDTQTRHKLRQYEVYKPLDFFLKPKCKHQDCPPIQTWFCDFGGFLWYFSGVFSTCGSSSRFICGSSSRFLRYFWWTRCIWCIFRGFRVPCLSNDVLPMAKTAIRDHFSNVIYPILIHKTALRILIWLSWRLEPSNTSKMRTSKVGAYWGQNRCQNSILSQLFYTN